MPVELVELAGLAGVRALPRVPEAQRFGGRELGGVQGR